MWLWNLREAWFAALDCMWAGPPRLICFLARMCGSEIVKLQSKHQQWPHSQVGGAMTMYWRALKNMTWIIITNHKPMLLIDHPRQSPVWPDAMFLLQRSASQLGFPDTKRVSCPLPWPTVQHWSEDFLMSIMNHTQHPGCLAYCVLSSTSCYIAADLCSGHQERRKVQRINMQCYFYPATRE